MQARIKVESYDTSIWGGFERREYRVKTYLVGQGEGIDTAGLGASYRFEIAAIRPGAVELDIRPNLVLHAPEPQRTVGVLALQVGETAVLQTPSFDAWGNWTVSLLAIHTSRQR